MLFAFDLKRQAMLLVGGDKSGDWRGWYQRNIPIADERFDEHQRKLKRVGPASQRKSENKKGRRR